MKIAITGTKNYENKRKIKETVHKLMKDNSELIIISGGCKDGADKYVKKYALELGCQYLEFNPSHTNKNLYSALHENYYGKSYHAKNFFVRNAMMAKYCDCMIAFISNNDVDAKGSYNAIQEAKKYKKKVVIIS
tara:strand:- start:2056 stop:2457 length:402 start_codon:yes stop_codon:yes gene_type:complete